MNEHLESLREIRAMMEKSSKFLSLSGLSGISAGTAALVAAYVVYARKAALTGNPSFKGVFEANAQQSDGSFVNFLLLTAALTILVAIVSGAFFTIRKAGKRGERVWNKLSKRLFASMMIPLLTGGLFCLLLISHGLLWVVPSATLIFYGLSLLSAANFTVRDVYWLGISEIILGLLSMVFTGYSLLFWALGFGVLHIIYGTLMYVKYDK